MLNTCYIFIAMQVSETRAEDTQLASLQLGYMYVMLGLASGSARLSGVLVRV